MKQLIMFVAAVAMLAVAAPALADIASPSPQFSVGARMLTDIGWWNKSEELTASGKDVGTWFLNMPGHSFLRTRYYSADKSVGGRIELGLKSLQPEASVNLRYAYGYWRVGKFRILAGQTDNWFGSLAYHVKQYVGLNEDSHLLLFGWGFLWPHRVPQVQFTYNTAKFGVQFALEEPRQKNNYWGATGVDTKFTFPRASLTLMFKSGGFMTHPGISFVQHQYEVATGADDSYNTWAFVLPVKFTAGAFTLKFQGHSGVNFATEYPFYPTDWTRPYLKDISSGDVSNTNIWGGVLAGEYKVGKLTITGGVGYEGFTNEAWSEENGYSKDEIIRWAAFVAVPYQVRKNFGVHPEISYYNHGDNPETGEAMGSEWLLGVQLRFVF